MPEMEKFLLAKLQSGIDRKIPCCSKFEKMKKLLETQLESAADEKETIKVRDKLYRLNNIMNEKKHSKFDFLSWRLTGKLNKIKKDIESAAAGQGVGGDRIANTAVAAAEKKKSTRELATKKALGLEADLLAVRNLILYQSGNRSDDFNAVGIVGAEGVGKTTLAQSVFAQEEVKDRFLPRIWISLLSEDPVDEEAVKIAIAKRILLALGVSGDGDDLAALIHAIRMELMGKRYFIVLDDASRIEEWYEELSLELTPWKKAEERLAFAFPKGSGGTVMAVGWPENVVEDMVGGDGSGIHRLLPLEDPVHCWEIYKEAAAGGDEEGIGDDEKKVKDEVVKRSSGHPGAARFIGKITSESVMRKRNQETAADSTNPSRS